MFEQVQRNAAERVHLDLTHAIGLHEIARFEHRGSHRRLNGLHVAYRRKPPILRASSELLARRSSAPRVARRSCAVPRARLGSRLVATWIFGYGSLVWRPAFPAAESAPAVLDGWMRRFWQGSTDHRGVPGAPGRVVTLLERAGERTGGLAYRVDDEQLPEILAGLDVREQGGYRRALVPARIRGRARPERVLLYVATPDNPNYLGPATLPEIAVCVLASQGPSGPNAEYVLRLDQALRKLELRDEHVSRLAQLVRAVGG